MIHVWGKIIILREIISFMTTDIHNQITHTHKKEKKKIHTVTVA